MSDDLFRLGWLDDHNLASPCLTALAEKAALYRNVKEYQGVFEDDTRAIFVEPLLRGLGWDTLNHCQVDREFPAGKGNIIGDIWLVGRDHEKQGKIAVAMEVKSLESDPGRMLEAYQQLRSNVLENLFKASPGSRNEPFRLELDGKPFVRGVVTNGNSWTVYDFAPSVPEPHEPVCKFDLQDGSEQVALFVRAIGRQHLLNKLGLS
jgi:hypothetical protein